MEEIPKVRPVQLNEADRFAATMTLALAADPSTRWVTPDAGQYVRMMMPISLAFGGQAAIERNSAYVLGEFLGVAIFLPPGVPPDDEKMGEIFAGVVPEPHLAAVYALFEKMSEFHPTAPHWYLPLIGVDPAYQGRGVGSALMRHGLATCDRDGTIAYLEATGPRSLPFYNRHGFETIGEIVIGNSPPMYPMVRHPR